MDWESNLAAIIKCTDAHLEQQFRQLGDLDADLPFADSHYLQHAGPQPPPRAGDGGVPTSGRPLEGDSLANAYLRESLAASQQPEQAPPLLPLPKEFTRRPAAPVSFSAHFRQQREQKRAAKAMDNQRAQFQDEVEEEEIGHFYGQGVRMHAPPSSSIAYQAFASPTYDMAQMMEQVRLSLKLEVDARAAIAERQLSALLQLCKSTSEELDRLRVEVCAADRQLHTLDQVQAKLRQELTTQKDIGFHLQSMCGKDESWRMQAESQLLELRQMVAALREQCNSVQSSSQEKLSRSELQVHFNAAMEPVKAQLQASAHHQAQQIAELSRSCSASTLMLDALTQKMNHGVAGDVADLRNDVTALKTQLGKLFGERLRDSEQQQAETTRRKEGDEAKAREERLESGRQQLKQLVEKARVDISAEVRAFVVDELKQAQRKSKEAVVGVVRRPELDTVAQRVEDNWRSQLTSFSAQAEKQLKTLESQLHSEFGNGLRDLLKQIEQAKQAAAELAKAGEARAESCENQHSALAKKLKREQEDRRQLVDTTHEALRAIRGDVQQNLHSMEQDLRARQLQAEHEAEKRVREAEKKAEEELDRVHKDVRSRFAEMEAAVKVFDEKVVAKSEQRVRSVEDAIAKTNATVAALHVSIGALQRDIGGESSAKLSKATPRDVSERDEIRSALEKQTSAFVSAIDTSMQRMQLQLQLQLQAQSHTSMVLPASAYSGHWTVPATPTAPALTLSPHLQVAPATGQNASITHVADNSLPVTDTVKNQGDTNSWTPLDDSLTVTRRVAEQVTPSASLLKDTRSSVPAPQSLREEANAISLLPVPEPISTADKIQETISMSARGAMAEAELAKARVESRRKQELELRQREQSNPTPVSPLIRGPPVPTSCPSVDSIPGRAPPPPPAPLARAASTSALPVGGTDSKLPAPQDPEAVDTLERTRSSSVVDIPAVNPLPTSKTTDTTPSVEAKLVPAPANSLGGLASVPPPPPRDVGTAPSAPPAANTTGKPLTTARVDAPTQAASVMPSLPAPAVQLKIAVPPPAVRTATEEATDIKQETPATTSAQANATPPFPSSSTSALPPGASSPSSVMQKLFGNLPRSSSQKPVDKALHQDVKPLPPPPPPPPAVPALTSRVNSTTSTANNFGSSAGGTAPSSPAHVLCSLCRLPIRKEQREEHERKQCPRRLVECSKCDTKMLCINLEVHSKSCSPSHGELGAAPPASAPARSISISSPALCSTILGSDLSDATDSPKKCHHCSADVPAAELLDHETRCDKVLKQCPHCLRRQKMSELQDHIENCDCRLVSCPNDCGGKFLQRGIEKHLATRCPKKPGGPTSPVAGRADSVRPTTPGASTPSTPRSNAAPGGTARSSSVGPQPLASAPPSVTPTTIATARSGSLSERVKADGHSSASSAVSVPATVPPPPPASSVAAASGKPSAKAECKFCDEEYPADNIDAHELECHWRPKRCQHCNMVIISRDLARHEASCKTNFKNCQHCDESMPQSALSTHSARCSKRPIKCIRCCQLFPADSIVAHSTTCKFVPGSAASAAMPAAPPPPGQASQPPPSSAPPSRASSGSIGTGSVSVDPPSAPRVPPPPPYPSTFTSASMAQPKPATLDANDMTRVRAASVDISRLGLSPASEESTAERMARRSLALSQLTNPGGVTSNPLSSSGVAGLRNPPPTTQPSAESGGEGPEFDEDEGETGSRIAGGNEETGEDEEGNEDEDDADEHLTLAQVVAEWTVDNVCVWLHEDVGVPDVVPRFQQQRCDGAMLLELTESDLVNDFGIRNRIHRERILNAIEAVKMSDDDDDDDDDDYIDDEEDEEGEEDDASGDGMPSVPAIGGRHSLAVPSRQAGELLPSSSAMFRRINSALDLPKK